jgi:hypothetical protein
MTDTLLDYPREPDDGEVAEDTATLRYDDLVQDGRIRLESAWRPTGRALWSHPSLAKIFRSMGPSITTVLSRVALQATDAVLAPRAPVTTSVRYHFEHTVDAAGDVDRLLFSTWLTARSLGKDGAEKLAARAYGERVFTDLSAPPGKHLVKRLSGFGESGIPEHRGAWAKVTSLLELPRGATPVDDAPRLDPGRVVFGITHTDLNQHVNFNMYVRAIEQAALARFHDLGRGAKLVSRAAELGYRKPSFAGEVVRIAVRAFELGGDVGVVAAVVDDDGGPAERPDFRDFGSARVVARMVLKK